MTLLNDMQIGDKLKVLNNWTIEQKMLCKHFQFKDFKEALDFVNRTGAIAEELNHHPDILLYSWNKVKICVSTHDEGGITDKDFKLANRIEGI